MIFWRGRISLILVHGLGSWPWFVVLVRGLGSCRHEPITFNKKILSKFMNKICIHLLFLFRHQGSKKYEVRMINVSYSTLLKP